MRASVFALLACCIASEAIAQHLVVPDAPDLMLKTRRVDAGRRQRAFTQVLYLKGARQRRETGPDASRADRLVWFSITQCDERRHVVLNGEAKTYAYQDVEDPSAYLQRMRTGGRLVASPAPPSNAPVTTLTIETTDTGERRSFGSYTARHVITSRKIDPPTGGMGGMPTQEDGWYIDVPDPGCWDSTVESHAGFIISLGSFPRLKVERRGNGRIGYPIEETQRYGDPASPHESRLELVEVSEAPLDDALFEVPKDYQPALQTPYGPDMSKPDTILNRLSWYGNQMVATVQRWFQPTYGAGY